MSWIVEWNGRQLDADPHDFTGRELAEIKRVTGLTFKTMLEAIVASDLEAFRVIFYTLDRRQDGALLFRDYDGPTVRWILDHLDNAKWGDYSGDDDTDGAADAEGKESNGTSGSPPSLIDSDTPAPNTTS